MFLIEQIKLNFIHFFLPLGGAFPPFGAFASSSFCCSSQTMSSAGVRQAAPLIFIKHGSSSAVSSAGFFFNSQKLYALLSPRTVLAYSRAPAFKYFLSPLFFSTRSVIFFRFSSPSYITFSSWQSLILP